MVRRPHATGHLPVSWRRPFGTAKTRISRRPSIATDPSAPVWQQPSNGRARNCPITTSTTLDAAFELVAEFDPADGPACAIIKHANPCGVARAATLAEAYQAAFDCDRTSAFGGIIALNQPLDGPTAELICEIFTEVVIAPGADDAAKAVFAAKKNLRLLTTECPAGSEDRQSDSPSSFGRVAGSG